MAFAVLYVTAPVCHAASIYRCVDAYGRVSVGDLPCAVKPAVAYKKEQENKKEQGQEKEKQAAAGAQTDKGQEALLRDILEQKILSKHSTQCRDLRLLLRKNGHFVSHPLTEATSLSDVDKLAREQYQVICMAQAKDVVVLAQVQSERISAEKARKAACDVKLREYESRKHSLNSTSSDLERHAFGVLQAEVSRGCR
ncbi:MAG: hypothetical protein RL171_2376 [Pseudomonadota bacterium]